MDYIKADKIVDRVVNELQGYFDANMVEESLLYPEIKDCLDFLGMKVMPEKKVTFTVKNYCHDLPEDFHRLTLATACTAYKIDVRDPVPNASFEKCVTVEDIPACYNPCEYYTDVCGNCVQFIQRFDTHHYEFRDFRNLTISTESQGCDADCVNTQSQNHYDIKIINKQIHTNFKEATVYMEYKAKLHDKVDLFVPDILEVREWIKFHLHYVIFRKLYLNGDTDAQGRYTEAQRKADIHKEIARGKLKNHPFSEWMSFRAFLRRQFNATFAGIPQTLVRRGKNRFPSGGISF